MKLQFEEWIFGQDIPFQAQESIKEAILCYKASAYRSALLFSYLCFQIVIRERLLGAQNPKDFPPSGWEDIQNKLRRDDKWDAQVFDAIIMNSNGKEIFIITDDLRNQVRYWRDRRNDCAHLKSNTINFSHVESFWTFLQCNLFKFMVNGSKQALLEKISKHFDIRITKPNTNFNTIIKEIPFALNDYEHLVFLEEAHQILCNQIGDSYYHDDCPSTRFWEALFSINSEPFLENLITFLLSQKELSIGLIDVYPKLINYFSGEPTFIRQLWFDLLYSVLFINENRIFCALLRNNLIPSDQVIEAIDRFILKSSSWIEEINDSDLIVLKENRFFERLKDYIFKKNDFLNFEWANKKVNLIIFCLKFCDFDADMVQEITSTFSSSHFPFKLCNHLKTFFNENKTQRENYLLIAKNEGLIPPKELGFDEE